MADYNDILKAIKAAVKAFNGQIPAAQKQMYQEIAAELKRLDLNGDTIKASVANLKVIQSIRAKINRLLLTDKYLDSVKEFAKAFNTITTLHNDYWKAVESTFKPRPLLREIRKLAIETTVSQLTEAGIGSNIGENITDILQQNITGGGSYKALQEQLLESLSDTDKSAGLLTKHARQITVDSINQYSAQYTQAVMADLDFEWYAYQGTDILTTRPFCDAMTDIRYFHASEIPALLRADNLYYVKDGKRTKVPIYPKTGLPHGMIEGTNPENFFVRRGGYNCGHQIRPVSDKLVPQARKDEVFATAAYKNWKKQHG